MDKLSAQGQPQGLPLHLGSSVQLVRYILAQSYIPGFLFFTNVKRKCKAASEVPFLTPLNPPLSAYYYPQVEAVERPQGGIGI